MYGMLEVRFCYNRKRTPHCKATRNRSKRKEVPHSGVSCIRPASLPLRAVFQWRRVRFRGAVSLRFPPPHCAVIAFGISVKRTPPCGITRKAVHIIHMMGEEIVYGGIVVYSLRDCKIFFNFFYNDYQFVAGLSFAFCKIFYRIGANFRRRPCRVQVEPSRYAVDVEAFSGEK